MKNGYKVIIFILMLIGFLLIPYFIDLFIIGNETIKINVKKSDFFLFLGSYLGAAFGALITIVGALWLNEKERTLKENRELEEKKEKEEKELNLKKEKLQKIYLLFFNTIYLEYSNLEEILKALYNIPNFRSGSRRADTIFLRKIIKRRVRTTLDESALSVFWEPGYPDLPACCRITCSGKTLKVRTLGCA